MAADRFLLLARDLRMAALGREGNPPGISRFGVGALGGRIDALADHLPAALAAEARARAVQLGTQDEGLTPEETDSLAQWLEAAAEHACPEAGAVRLKSGPSGGDAA